MFKVPNQHRLTTHPILGSDDSFGNNGFFIIKHEVYEIRCQASDKKGWEHVSVTISRNHPPPWKIMCFVKDLFWEKEDTVIQFHPPESKYVNLHENCLHLWRSTEEKIKIPETELIG